MVNVHLMKMKKTQRKKTQQPRALTLTPDENAENTTEENTGT